MQSTVFPRLVAACALLTPPLSVKGLAVEKAVPAMPKQRTVLETLTEVDHRGFMQALSRQDQLYDPKERMIRRPFSSPGYHTTLQGGVVHPTRQSLSYAVALLDSGEKARLLRAQEILRRVVMLQDQNPSSRTYGIWPWFLEEPLDKMSPPDWNWADFCGVQLLQVAIDHIDRLPPDLAEQVKRSILHAARSIKRRNVGPGYTNIALMGTYVTLVAGERLDQPDLTEYGKKRLGRFYDYTLKQGSFSEYNSPTYTIVAIEEISRMLRHVQNAASRKLLKELNHIAWYHVARRFHPPTRQWAGPHSRCYSTLLPRSALAFIQRATEGKARLTHPEDAAVSLDAHRLQCRCPDDLIHYFVVLPEPRFEKEVFVRGPEPLPDIVGSTYLDAAFTLGSVNCGNLWNQRRPLIAYWGNAEEVSAFRIRCLHDGYDYSSAMFFSVQDKGDLLAAVNFATDRGDTHPSLDPIKNATIRARDFRLRFLIEGSANSPPLPSRFQIGQPCTLDLGSVALDLCVPYAAFGDFPIKTETGRDHKSAWLDVVLYHGEEREVRFPELKEAVICFAIRLKPAREEGVRNPMSASSVRAKAAGNNLSVVWKRDRHLPLSIGVSTIPARQSDLRSTANACIGDADACK